MRIPTGESGPTVRDLIVWQKAMGLAEQVYGETRTFPAEERFALTSQLRRAAISIASNIAEGHGRGGAAEFRQFLRVARGSARELDTQIELARRFGYLTNDVASRLAELIDHVSRLLTNLMRSLR